MAGKNFPLSLQIKAADMASGPIGRLATKLNLLTAPGRKLSKEFGALGKALNVEGFSKVGSSFKNMTGEIGSLITKFAALSIGAGVAGFAMVKSAVDAGDKLGEMADRVGLSVDVYASLGHAAAQADIDQEQFNGAMDQFSKRLGEAKAGGGGMLEFLKKVSPRLAEQVKHAKGTEAALSLMTDAMAKIQDPSKRAALAAAAFGKSGLQMGNFLHQGSAAIQEQQREYLRLAGSQEAFARGAGDLDNAMRETETAFMGLRTAVGSALFPVFTKLSKTVTEFVVKNRDGLSKWADAAGGAIQKWIDGGGVERLIDGLGKVASAVGGVIDFLGPMGVALAAGAVTFGPLIASAVSFGASVVSILPTLGSFAAAVGGALLPLTPFIAAAAAVAWAGSVIYKNWDDLAFIFKDWGNSIKWAVLDAWDAVKPILDKLGTAFEFLSRPFKAAFEFGANLFGDNPRPTLGAADALPAQPSASQSEAKVSVDFSNLPRGARVSVDPNSTANLDISRGVSMAGAQ